MEVGKWWLDCDAENLEMTPGSTVRGVLCGWDAYGEDGLHCNISRRGQLEQFDIKLQRVARIQLLGETGKLHHHILRPLGALGTGSPSS